MQDPRSREASEMILDEQHDLNLRVIEYISKVKHRSSVVPLAAPDSVADPYMKEGSHPDVVERVWDVIGRSLPQDCRCLVYGTPALVHPHTGIIIAFCNGTTYCLRLPEQLIDEALKAGARTYTKWTGGGDMDTQRDLGADWVFGWWLDDELDWCRQAYEELGKITS